MPICSLIVETILNMLTGNLFALLIIPIFIILVDFFIRMFAKNEVFVKGFNNFTDKASLLFKFICIMPKIISVISLIALSALFNYMTLPLELATLVFMANIIVNIFTIYSCVKLYHYELSVYDDTKRNIINENKVVQENLDSKVNLGVENKRKIEKQEQGTFVQGWRDFWEGYFDFRGIATQTDFWWGLLDYIITLLAFNIINGIVIMIAITTLGTEKIVITSLFIIASIIKFILLIPLLALAARRLRDIGIKNSIILFLIISYAVLHFAAIISQIATVILFILAIVIAIYCNMPTGKYSKQKSSYNDLK
ncbi:DUF805 domain-containing protein [Ligilactobacillus sp. LYQ135]